MSMVSGKSPTARGRFVATVTLNTEICKDHYALVLGLEAFPATYPGQFVELACRNVDLDYSPETEFSWEPGEGLAPGGLELMNPLALLRRPFSLAGRRVVDGGVELEFIYRTVGVGTTWMSRLLPGSAVHLIGPLGNHFELPPGDGAAILVGGGVGIPPMLYLASALAGRRAVLFAGALNRDLLPLTITADSPSPGSDSVEPLYNIAEAARHNIPAVIATDDGSFGFHGLVTQALEQHLDRFTHHALRITIYTCGPEPMMKRVAQIAIDRGIECQISVERAMACGMGTCQSCVIRVKKADRSKPPLAGKEWCYRLACTDGPIFKASELLW